MGWAQKKTKKKQKKTLDMTFDLCHTPSSIGQPSWPVQSVNEVEDPDGMVGTFWPEEGLPVSLYIAVLW